MPSKVIWDIVVPVKQPADLKGTEPGKIPGHLLRPARGEGGKPCGQLHWLAAAAWAAMCEAAEKDKVLLKPVSAGDTYRTFASQLSSFLTRYQKEPIPGASTRTFQGVKWYKKSPKLASLAAPGTSQHNSGLAVDVHTAAEPKRLQWLVNNVRKFGFSWEVVPEEPWHLRYTEGDNPPAAVVEYMTKNGITPPVAGKEAPKAEAPKAEAPKVQDPKPEAKSDEELVPGAKGERVRLLQEKLKEKGFYLANCDGDFGPKTSKAVKKFKQANNLPAGPKVGKKAQELLGM
jgi:hypothetical protein